MAFREIPVNLRRVIAELDESTVNVSAFCRDHGVSRQQFYELRRRFVAEGDAGLEPRSRAPRTVANRTSDEVEDRIIEIRKNLVERGVDAGADTIVTQLKGELDTDTVPSPATVWRILVRRGFIEPEPRKAPNRRWRRFAAERANECWQMDSTGYGLRSGTIVDIINVIDDCSRAALDGFVVPSCTAPTAWKALERSAVVYGWPERVLRDNAKEFKAHQAQLAQLGIEGKHSRPYHPQTCGKVERYQQTLKKFLDANGPYRRIADLQQGVDEFRDYYNHQRPHRAIDRQAPAAVWAATPKSGPSEPIVANPTTRVHSIKVNEGRITVGRHRITIGARYHHQQATVLITGHNCHVFIDGRLIRELTIDPTRTDQPLHDRPGRPRT